MSCSLTVVRYLSTVHDVQLGLRVHSVDHSSRHWKVRLMYGRIDSGGLGEHPDEWFSRPKEGCSTSLTIECRLLSDMIHRERRFTSVNSESMTRDG